MKKMLAVVLVCVLMLTALPAMADNVRTSGLYTYEIKGNGTVVITEFNWKESQGDVFIPRMLDGYTVTAIGDFAFAPVKEFCMDGEKFYNSSGYGRNISITIPDTITTIGEFAFYRSNIKAINIPVSVRSIGQGAFVCCRSISFNLDPNHEVFAVISGTLYNKTTKELIFCPSGKTTIPEGIVSIGNYAFAETYNINDTGRGISVKLPSTITSIGNYAFYEADDAYVYLPDNLQTIGDYAFAGVREVENAIPDSVYQLGVGAFSNCGNTTEIVITSNSGLREIPSYAFANNDEKQAITIDATNIDTLGDYAFAGFRGRKIEITNTSNFTRIGEWAFEKCSPYVLSFDFSPRITTIPAGFNLKATLPDTIKRIEAFAYQYTLDDFYLPASLTYIDEKAFFFDDSTNNKNSSFVVEKGSYAETWASENGYSYSYSGQDSLDWLNN